MEKELSLQASPTLFEGAPGARSTWLLPGLLVVTVFVWLLVWYGETSWSMVAIWKRSETFGHGFLIFPISALLIWSRRHALAALEPKANLWGLPILLLLGFSWLLAKLAGVLVIEQYALVLILISVIWTMLGTEVVYKFAFPFGFLLFAVPIGEFLIPPLMDFTADFTVIALQLTGIPIYREGTFFSIPSGNWSIVEGCSGLRYLIASFTLGTLYAYLTYRSRKRRLVFALISLLVPILANGLRAYMIVMIAHLSDMKLALGVDHYIYGWVFFGLIMLLLFWIGSFWREDPKEQDSNSRSGTARRAPAPGALGKLLVATLGGIGATAIWPAYATFVDSWSESKGVIQLAAPNVGRGWRVDRVDATNWRPRYRGADSELVQSYRKADKVVMLYVAYYRSQQQDAELINSQNVMVRQKHPTWSSVGESYREIKIDRSPTEIRQTLLRSPTQRLMVWDWFWLNKRYTSNRYFAKALLAKNKLLRQPDDGVAVIVASPYDEQPLEAALILEEFVEAMLPSLKATVGTVVDAKS